MTENIGWVLSTPNKFFVIVNNTSIMSKTSCKITSKAPIVTMVACIVLKDIFFRFIHFLKYNIKTSK